jgi:hypothetical protein
MTRSSEPTGRPAPLQLEELFTRYLGRQAEAQALGLGHAESTGEVEPYEAVPVQPVEPRLAWTDAVSVAGLLGAPKTEWPVLPEWPALVAAQEPAVAVPFALGNFPQLVRDLHPLVASGDWMASRKAPRPLPVGDLMTRSRGHKSAPETLLVAGVLRLAQHFDEAATALGRAEDIAADWRAVHANEAAALDWQRGQQTEALAQWEALPASVPVLFNRGMALLFLNRPVDARANLSGAIAGLKETNAWYHLSQLYLTLANGQR